LGRVRDKKVPTLGAQASLACTFKIKCGWNPLQSLKMCRRGRPRSHVISHVRNFYIAHAHEAMKYPNNVLLYIVMKTAIRVFILFLLVHALSAADYKIKIVEVQPIESYPAQATVGGITIAANPYSTDAESATAFDIKKLNSRGFFPLHVIIKNESSSYLTIRTRNVLLFTPDGEQLYSTPAAIVVDSLSRAGLTKKEPAKSDEPETAQKVSPLVDFTSKELIAASIDPGAVVDGFLFFFTEKPKKNIFAGSSLYIPKLEEEGTKKPFGPFTIRLDVALKK